MFLGFVCFEQHACSYQNSHLNGFDKHTKNYGISALMPSMGLVRRSRSSQCEIHFSIQHIYHPATVPGTMHCSHCGAKHHHPGWDHTTAAEPIVNPP